jgi:serine/threonine protein kinase/predicted ATPase
MSVEPVNIDGPQGTPDDAPSGHAESSLADASDHATIIIVKLDPEHGPSSEPLPSDGLGPPPEAPPTAKETRRLRAVRREAKAKAAAQDSMPKSLGRYEIQRLLGSGTFGSVFLGFDTSLNRQVAIKVPKIGQTSQAKAQFLAEARQLAQLRHPGIVAVFDVGVDEEQCFIVSDYLHGQTLNQWIETHRPSWLVVVKICADIAEALSHAHASRTVHRDLKPGNIIMIEGARPVIVDFGLAVSDSTAGESTPGKNSIEENPERGVVVGTPAYMSPEQTRGEGHRIDGRTDLYSLGVMLYAMLTGRLPFPSRQLRELFLQIQNDEPQPPRQLVPTLPRELERIVLKAMAKSLSERYTTALDLAEDLQTLLAQWSGSGSSVPGVGPTKSFPPSFSASVHTTLASTRESVIGQTVVSPQGLANVTVPPRNPQTFQPGSSLEAPGSSHPAVRDSRSVQDSTIRRVREAERRRITVLDCGCDVFTSAEIQESLGPEEQGDLLVQYQNLCRTIVAMFEGSVIQTTDDGLMACFGYPVAVEDATLRAVRAGLKLLETMTSLNQRIGKSYHVSLSTSLAAHSDLAVVEDKGEGNQISIVGQVRNVASQLGDIADIGNLVISEDTYRLARGYFDCESLGKQRLKGIGEKGVYRVLSERRASSRIEATESVGLTPLVGRDQEVGLLEDRWGKASEGIGQVVLLIGDPGLGKSRLVQVLKAHVARDPHASHKLPSVSDSVRTSDSSHYNDSSVVRKLIGDSSFLGKMGGQHAIIEWRAAQHLQNSSLRPVIAGFERLMGFTRLDSADKKLDKVISHLKQLKLDGPDEIALIASMLSIPSTGRVPELKLAPDKQKEKTLELLLDCMRAMAAEVPMLFIVEDLHWLDPTTLEFIQRVVEESANDSILTVLTSRPEFVVPWTNLAYLTQISLSRLSRRQIEEMISVRAGVPVPQRVMDLIIERTDGVPLFVEEFTAMMVESGALQQIPEDGTSVRTQAILHEIPASLQDLLMARLHRLDCNLDVVQLCASIGREFSYEVLQAASPLDESKLQQELAKLVKAEILLQRGRGSRLSFSFKHALLQDAAWQSMLKKKRQQFHQRIGEAIEQNFPDICSETPEVLAQHFTEAGVAEKAIEFWDRASVRSLKRSAHREAIEQLTRGIELLRALPETRERAALEVDFHVRLGVSLQSTKGYSAPEVETNYERAHELCNQLGDTDKAFPVLYGLFRYFMLRANYGKSRELASQLIEIADASQNPSFLVAAHRAMGGPLVYLGEHEAALKHFARVLTIEVTPELRNSYHYEVVDPWIVSRSYMAWALWFLGYPDQARKHAEWAVAEAERLEHPFSIALSLSFSQWFHQFCGDIDRTREVADRSLHLSREQNFAFWIGWCQVLRGWCISRKEDPPAGLTEVQRGLTAWLAVGSRLGLHYFHALEAEACLAGGAVEAGLKALEEAHAFSDQTGEGFWRSELSRLRGELLLRRDGMHHAVTAQDAEACFRSALVLAGKQHAKSLELRAAMSLARLWHAQGRTQDARDLLTPVSEWFTEGLDTSDLIEAKTLLSKLS